METKYTEIIDKYLNGELEEKELFEFNKRLKTDKQLQRELKLEEELNPAIGDEDVIDFRKEIIEVRKSMLNENSFKEDLSNRPKTIPIFSKNKQWYLIAASVIVLLGISIYFFFVSNSNLTNDQLYAQYYAPYPASISIRSDDTSINNSVTLGFIEYEKSNFGEAVIYFNSAKKADSTNIPVRFYLGIACMETGLLSEAESNFKIVIENKFNLFTEQAKWYLALTYLKSGDDKYRPQINQLLNEIVEEKGDRAKEARDLLIKMKHNII